MLGTDGEQRALLGTTVTVSTPTCALLGTTVTVSTPTCAVHYSCENSSGV